MEIYGLYISAQRSETKQHVTNSKVSIVSITSARSFRHFQLTVLVHWSVLVVESQQLSLTSQITSSHIQIIQYCIERRRARVNKRLVERAEHLKAKGSSIFSSGVGEAYRWKKTSEFWTSSCQEVRTGTVMGCWCCSLFIKRVQVVSSCYLAS